MAERSRIFDDVAGVAGGAFSALAGIGEELGALVRARVDEALSRLALVRREEFEAVSEMAATAREGQETLEARVTALEARIAALGSGSGRGGAEQHGLEGAPGGPPPRGHDDAPDAPPPAR